ncbi:MAG: M42 family metallopeptidase [Proteobacteria bacterium]|nr:M42 family metallopeptidase [Pseudomonadota bacterium]
MNKESQQFLLNLLETPSPSGFEQGIQKVVRKHMTKYADDINIDIHGNLIASWNPEGSVKVMLAGHCDQIGLMVNHINDNGFIHFGSIGGIDPAVLPGSYITIHAREGKVEGVIGHKPVHLITPEERGKQVSMSNLWIDIGAASGDETKKLVSVGDPITFKLAANMLNKNIIASAGCDDKVGLFVCMEALRIVSTTIPKRKKHPVALYAVSTVQEEIGLRGAKTSCYGIDPLVGIAVDVTHASDNPGADAKNIGSVKLGKGPTIARGANINPVLEELLVDTAKKKKLPYQPLSAPNATGTDANAIQISKAGVAAALIGIPNRYMHTQVEICDLRDLETAAKLIAETVIRITSRTSFIP